FQSHVGRRRVPNYRQILCQTQKRLFTRRRYRLAFVVEVMQFTFKPLHFLQSSIPASFQFCSDQPLIGIDGFISPSCQTCFVASLLELQLNGSAQIASLLLHLSWSSSRQLNGSAQIASLLLHLFRSLHSGLNCI